MRGRTASLAAALVIGLLALSFAAYKGAQPTSVQTNSSSSGTTSTRLTTVSASTSEPGPPSSQASVSQEGLIAMAGAGYSSGPIPVGDGRYIVQTPEVGYIDYCGTPPTGGGAQGSAPWIVNGSWYPSQKPHVEGNVSWPNARFSDTVSGSTRTLSGNGLPVGYPTGTFPIQKSDPAYQYDANPNSVQPHTIDVSLPVDPTYSDTPHCLTPGMVGIMTDGVPLFDGMDAAQRDAVAHEVQDLCSGHPDGSDVYHYHDLSACFKDLNETHILGYALDGFPITGPEVAPGKYLDTANLDVCHGVTGEVVAPNGTVYTTYHYVLTYDFPYSIGCFRGTPAANGNGTPLAATGGALLLAPLGSWLAAVSAAGQTGDAGRAQSFGAERGRSGRAVERREQRERWGAPRQPLLGFDPPRSQALRASF